MRAIVLCFMALPLATAPLSAQAQHQFGPDQKLLADIYVQGVWQDFYAGDPKPLHDLQKSIDVSVQKATTPPAGPLRFFYHSSSDEVRIPRTERRVSGAYPSCGQGTAQLGDDVQEYLTALGGLATAVDRLFGTGVLAKVIAGLISTAIGNANLYQTEANCADICTLVPAQVPEAALFIETYYRVDSGPLMKRRAPSDFGEWSHIEKPVVSHGTVKHGIKAQDPLRQKARDEQTCEMRLVCSRVRNWSAHRDISAKIDVYFDADPSYGKMCVDYTMASDDVQDALITDNMERDRAKAYFDAWSEHFTF